MFAPFWYAAIAHVQPRDAAVTRQEQAAGERNGNQTTVAQAGTGQSRPTEPGTTNDDALATPRKPPKVETTPTWVAVPSLTYTPTHTHELESFRFYCPLCMRYFLAIMETTCCKHYVCPECARSYLAKRAPAVLENLPPPPESATTALLASGWPVEAGATTGATDASPLAALRDQMHACVGVPATRIAGVPCPSCATTSQAGFYFATVVPDGTQKPRSYMDSPATTAALATLQARSGQLRPPPLANHDISSVESSMLHNATADSPSSGAESSGGLPSSPPVLGDWRVVADDVGDAAQPRAANSADVVRLADASHGVGEGEAGRADPAQRIDNSAQNAERSPRQLAVALPDGRPQPGTLVRTGSIRSTVTGALAGTESLQRSLTPRRQLEFDEAVVAATHSDVPAAPVVDTAVAGASFRVSLSLSPSSRIAPLSSPMAGEQPD